jgi:hypothetical protein
LYLFRSPSLSEEACAAAITKAASFALLFDCCPGTADRPAVRFLFIAGARISHAPVRCSLQSWTDLRKESAHRAHLFFTKPLSFMNFLPIGRAARLPEVKSNIHASSAILNRNSGVA